MPLIPAVKRQRQRWKDCCEFQSYTVKKKEGKDVRKEGRKEGRWRKSRRETKKGREGREGRKEGKKTPRITQLL